MFNIAIQDLRVFTKDRANMIFLLLVPLLMTFVIGYVNGGGFGSSTTQLRVDLIDNDNSALSAQFINSLHEANTSLVLCPQDNDENDFCQLGDATVFDVNWATERVKDGTSLAMIEIPSGFGADVQNFQPVQIVYLSNENFSAPSYIRQAVDSAIVRVNGAVVASRVGTNVASSLPSIPQESLTDFTQGVYTRAAEIWDTNPVTVTYQETEQKPDSGGTNLQAGLGQSVPGMGSMFVMFTVFGGITALIVERKQWTLQRLATMPVSRAQLIGGKILGRFALGILQFLVVFAMGFILGVNFGRDPVALVLIMVLYTLAVTALSFALGTQLKTEQQASGLSLLLSLALASLGGAWWPLDVVGETMRVVGHISPVAWAMDGFNQLTFYDGTLGSVLIPLAVLLGMTLVFFAFSIWRFKIE